MRCLHYDDPKVTLSARTMTAAIMLEIDANTRSGRALQAVTRPMRIRDLPHATSMISARMTRIAFAWPTASTMSGWPR